MALRDDMEKWNGVRWGRGVRGRGFALMCGRDHHNMAKQLSSN